MIKFSVVQDGLSFQIYQGNASLVCVCPQGAVCPQRAITHNALDPIVQALPIPGPFQTWDLIGQGPILTPAWTLNLTEKFMQSCFSFYRTCVSTATWRGKEGSAMSMFRSIDGATACGSEWRSVWSRLVTASSNDCCRVCTAGNRTSLITTQVCRFICDLKPSTYFILHKSFVWIQWYPCFGLMVTSVLIFKTKVDPLICVFRRLHAMDTSENHVCNVIQNLNSRISYKWRLFWIAIDSHLFTDAVVIIN